MNSIEEDIVSLYLKLKEKVVEENSYIKNNKYIDENYLYDLVTQKRVITDKIEKKSKNIEFSLEIKLKLGTIIEEIILLEQENEKGYSEKLDEIKKEILNIINEKKLKNKYSQGQNESFFINEKK